MKNKLIKILEYFCSIFFDFISLVLIISLGIVFGILTSLVDFTKYIFGRRNKR